MAQGKLTREQCEQEIVKHLKAIRRLYSRYHPDGDYLTLVIYNHSLSANNAYWEEADRKHPLDIYVLSNKRGSANT